MFRVVLCFFVVPFASLLFCYIIVSYSRRAWETLVPMNVTSTSPSLRCLSATSSKFHWKKYSMLPPEREYRNSFKIPLNRKMTFYLIICVTNTTMHIWGKIRNHDGIIRDSSVNSDYLFSDMLIIVLVMPLTLTFPVTHNGQHSRQGNNVYYLLCQVIGLCNRKRYGSIGLIHFILCISNSHKCGRFHQQWVSAIIG